MCSWRNFISAGGTHRKEKYDLKPIKPKKPEIERDGGRFVSVLSLSEMTVVIAGSSVS
jgi:hypothetical protein